MSEKFSFWEIDPAASDAEVIVNHIKKYSFLDLNYEQLEFLNFEQLCRAFERFHFLEPDEFQDTPCTTWILLKTADKERCLLAIPFQENSFTIFTVADETFPKTTSEIADVDDFIRQIWCLDAACICTDFSIDYAQMALERRVSHTEEAVDIPTDVQDSMRNLVQIALGKPL